MLTTLHKRIWLAIPVLLLAGCFETKLSLGPRESAKVDPKFLGDWSLTWKDEDKTKSADLLVTNFNGREYYVEWKPKDEDADRINGYIVDVKGAQFIQLTGINTDAQLDEKHVIARIEIKDDKLLIRHLNEDFFKDATTDADLQKRIADNLDNAQMYAWDMTGTKKPAN